MSESDGAIQVIRDALINHGSIIKDGTGKSFMAQCPAHDDRNPSLSVSPRRVSPPGALVHCHAGCQYTDVLAAINLTDPDLFDDKKVSDALAPVKTYIYSGGRKNHRQVQADGKKTFWQEHADDKSLYGCDRIGDAKVVFLCEGEKAADFLAAMGHAAVATGGAQRTCDLEPLAGRVVIVFADRDEAGHKWARRYAKNLQSVANSVSVVQAKVDIDKADIVEHVSAGYGMEDLEPVDLNKVNGHALEALTDIKDKAVRIEDIEEDFWTRRESLKIIYQTSLARMCSPWAVLACCAARTLTIVRPNATLPALIGGRGSLNWFAAIAAPSGGGKGSALAVARELVREFVYQRNLGSGEGLVTAFTSRPSDENPDGTREAVMFISDEIDSMSALGARTGSTLLSTLRSAFSGETLGFSYATKGRDIHLEAHCYRLTLICGVQPGRSGSLLGDESGGTPQRFMWFPGLDHRISKDTIRTDIMVPNLSLPPLQSWLYPREIFIPDTAVDYVVEQRVKAMRGESDSLDAHAIFSREKFAYALAVLDSRVEMTEDDWELSGIASNISQHTRKWVENELSNITQLEAEKRGQIRGIESHASDMEKKHQLTIQAQQQLRWVLKRLQEADSTGVSNRDLWRASDSRKREALGLALNNGIEEGLFKQSSDGVWFLA